MQHNYTEASIQKMLFSKYIGNSKFRIANVYLWFWESDFYVQKENGYCYEFEIKITRADFKKDADKIEKHFSLASGKREVTRTDFVRDPETGRYKFDENRQIITEKKTTVHECQRPNKFYYIAPEGVIMKNQVPAHAGLMLITPEGRIYTEKEAPFLHKDCIDYSKSLSVKFYNYFMAAQDKIHGLKFQNDKLRAILKKHNISEF